MHEMKRGELRSGRSGKKRHEPQAGDRDRAVRSPPRGRQGAEAEVGRALSANATRRALDFASIVFVVLVLVPSGAHLLELHNKLGLVIPIALFLVAAQVVVRWRERDAIGASLTSLLCLVAAHAIFWTFTFPANQVSVNWTAKPADFERVRARWEWSHGAGVLLNLAGFVALLVAVLFDPPSS